MFKWFKDNRFYELKGEIALLKTEIEVLKTNMANLRGLFNRKIDKKMSYDNDSEDDEQQEINEIIKAFGGSIPIELTEKYNKH